MPYNNAKPLEYPYPLPPNPCKDKKNYQHKKTQLDQQTKEKTRDKKLSKSGSRASSIIQSNLHKMKESKKLLLLLPSSSAGGLNPEEESFMLGAITIGEVPN